MPSVPSLGYKTLTYNCDAVACVYTTVATALYTNTFHLAEIIDHVSKSMIVSMIWGVGVSLGVYFFTIMLGIQICMSGNFIYDFSMGVILNTHMGSVDLKKWLEVRFPWMLLFLISLSEGLKQYEQYGYISPNMAFTIPATWLAYARKPNYFANWVQSLTLGLGCWYCNPHPIHLLLIFPCGMSLIIVGVISKDVPSNTRQKRRG